MRLLLSAVALLAAFAASAAFARPALAQCQTDPAHYSYDGRPHLYETANNYGSANCPGYTLVDVTYRALTPLPGTYLSWADTDPSTPDACAASKLTAQVWDRTTSPPVYKGERTSAGVWLTNRDPISNPGNTGACYIAPIRFETQFSFTAGRRYRFAVRAFRSGQKGTRDLVMANAPLPNLQTGCESLGGGFFCALIPSSGANNTYQRWPTASFRLRLESPMMKVAQGGDLFFQDGKFFQPHRTYSNVHAANYGYSNAALVYAGNVSSLDAFSCGDFKMLTYVNAIPTYSYLDEENIVTTANGTGYCVLNARNNNLYRVWVERSASNLLVVGSKWDRSTGRAAWGCLDGMCNADVRVASQYMRYTTTDRDSFVRRVFNLLHESRYCIEDAFQRRLPVPLSMDLHGERLVPNPTDSTSFGLGGPSITSVGFQGYHKAGTKRIEDWRDIRFELHESTHVFNDHLFTATLPGWLNEGLSIQTNRLTCDGHPDYLPDFWRAWAPGWTDGHSVGSEFFRRLETEYACDVTCTYGLWRSLIDNLGTRASTTNAEIKMVMELKLGRSLTPLFSALGIAF